MIDLAISEQFTEGGTRIVPGPRPNLRRVRRRRVPGHGHDRSRSRPGDDQEGDDARADQGRAPDARLRSALRSAAGNATAILSKPYTETSEGGEMRHASAPSRVFVAAAQRGRRSAQVDLTGNWQAVFHEDQPERIPGPALGDYLGLPDQRQRPRVRRGLGRVAADGARAPVPRALVAVHPARAARTCASGRSAIRRRSRSSRFTWTSATFSSGGTFWMDGRPHPSPNAEHTWMGFSTGGLATATRSS